MAFELRPVLYLLGLLAVVLGVSMAFPAMVDLANDNPDWQVFAWAGAMTVFFGVLLVFANSGRGQMSLNLRQGFLLTTVAWVLMAAFGALPFIFANPALHFADAFFESMSGLTTTGSTVLMGLDNLPPGILLWRAVLQWLGGIGIIVTAIAILPFLRVGGMQLFSMESSNTLDKAMPRASQMATAIVLIYGLLTAACAIFLWIAGMSGFDAVVHAMTTVSTGGFSSSDQSIGHFRSDAVEWIIIVFMLAGSLPFMLYIRMITERRFMVIWDPQVRAFLGFLATVCLVITLWVWVYDHYPVMDALRQTIFNVVSVVTTTGFSSTDYSLWGALPVGAFFLLTFVGGCTGSTAGGIKIFRFQVLMLTLNSHLWSLVYRHGVAPKTYAGRPLSEEVAGGVVLFTLLFIVTAGIVALILASLGLDLVTSLTGAATAVANVGPGLGPIIGPSGTFQALPDAAKWVLSAAMLLGRLEMFTVLVLFTPAFWRG